jgi:uncharacterized DUF497 family protein
MNRLNLIKHGVTFEEATTAFKDEQAILLYDEENYSEEDRFRIIWFSQLTRALIVCHCYREQDTVIHIISAGKATTAEIGEYGGA